MKKFWIIPCLLFAGVIVLTGCKSTNNLVNQAEIPQEIYSSKYNSQEYLRDSEEGDVTATTENGAAPSEFPKKIIKNGNVIIETPDVIGSYDKIVAFAGENGGYEFSQSTSAREENCTIDAVIKVPPEKLSLVMDFAAENGTLISSSATSNDITDSYYDSQLRLESLKVELAKYQDFLRNAKTTSEMLQVQSEINRVLSEIETIEGRLSRWNSQVDEATLTLKITQKVDPSLKRREIKWDALTFSDMGYLISSGFVAVVSAVYSFIQWIVIGVVVALPLLIIAGAVLIPILVSMKKKKRAEKSAFASQQSTNVRND